jgi:hypothetical protein
VPAFWLNHDSAQFNIDWWKGTIPAQPANTQVRYKVALFYGGSYGFYSGNTAGYSSIQPISDAEPSGSKLFGLNQCAITNFNPATASVWLHNDLNPANCITGLQSGFHIVRARPFLPRANKSSVYNTFLQTFYYDGQLPSGVIAFPPAGAVAITNSSYQVVIRTDNNVTGADFNIQDSDPANDDAATGQANGNGSTNGAPVFVAATQVTPDASLNQQYPNYPNEFRFTYVSVPAKGSATLTVRLKTLTTTVYPSRFTALATTVNTLAPANAMYFSNPSLDGMGLVLPSNTTYLLQACFTPALDSSNSPAPFSFYLNGVFQPRSNYIFRPSGSVPGCPGLNSFFYYWSPQEGSNVLELTLTNGTVLSTTRTVLVGIIGSPLDSDGDGVPDWEEIIAGTDPFDSNSVFRITGLTPGNPAEVLWSSVSNKTYQVFSTTNLALPMAPDPNTPAGGVPAAPNNNLTYWFDPAPDATNKFYRIEVLP